MLRLLSQVVALVLALVFLANAQCAASCMVTLDQAAAHACCKHSKTSQPKHCAHRVSPVKDAVLKARAHAEIPQLTAEPVSLAAWNSSPPNAAIVPPQERTYPPGPPLFLPVLRV